MWEMIKAEFRHIRHNRLLLLSAIVICFIPFLYSIFFLKSVWDPYGSTQDLPVAVVNKDVPVEYQGKEMAVGDDLVKELKKNDQLDWHFVSASEAKYGMSHRKYYTVITIPKDFSKDATTVLKKHPTQMKLHYSSNESLNYIGNVMSQVAMTKLNEKVRASVTNAYAKTMFKELKVLGKGMNQASSGAKQLDNGLVTLQSGVNQYVAGVSQVNNGVQTLRMGVAPLAAGAQQLASGSATLANGVAQYTGGVGQLAAGLNQLMANSGALSGGASQLSTGINQYVTGVRSLSSGLGQLGANTPAVKDGINQLVGGTQSLNQQVTAMIPQLQGQMTTMANGVQVKGDALAQALAPLSSTSSSMNDLASKLQQISTALGAMSSAVSQSATQQSAQLNAAADQLRGIRAANDADQQKLNAIAGQLSSSAGSQTELVNNINDLKTKVDALQAAVKQSADQAGQQTAAVTNAASELKQSLGTMNTASGQMLNTVGTQLTSGTSQLQKGAADLQKQSAPYFAGVTDAASGASQLNAKSGELQSGANTLASGIGQYTAGVAQAGAGAGQLTANSGALNSGAGQLAGALGQLNAQIPTLTAGVNQLANGTQQLVNNSPALVQGVTKLNAGAGQLATALGKGAKTVNGIKTSNRTAKMFAEPSKLKSHSYSYVPNYGHALAPYVLSVALYVGALIFNFVYPIRRVAIQGKSPVAWWASKVVLGSLIITIMAIAEGGIMMMLGLTVDHVPSFFGTLILFGLASMAVVMFLSMTFDNPGRFVAMVLLMLQLGGSGGTFPMEVTMKFYNVIHYWLPMTYSILGLRDGISGGLGSHYVAFCNSVLAGIAVVFFILTLLAMIWLQHHHFAGKSELDNNQELLGDEKDDDGMHLQDRDQTI